MGHTATATYNWAGHDVLRAFNPLVIVIQGWKGKNLNPPTSCRKDFRKVSKGLIVLMVFLQHIYIYIYMYILSMYICIYVYTYIWTHLGAAQRSELCFVLSDNLAASTWCGMVHDVHDYFQAPPSTLRKLCSWNEVHPAMFGCRENHGLRPHSFVNQLFQVQLRKNYLYVWKLGTLW